MAELLVSAAFWTLCGYRVVGTLLYRPCLEELGSTSTEQRPEETSLVRPATPSLGSRRRETPLDRPRLEELGSTSTEQSPEEMLDPVCGESGEPGRATSACVEPRTTLSSRSEVEAVLEEREDEKGGGGNEKGKEIKR